MSEEVPDGNTILVVPPEFPYVALDRIIEAKLARFNQQCDGRCRRDDLGEGSDVEQGAARVDSVAGDASVAAQPDELPVAADGQRSGGESFPGEGHRDSAICLSQTSLGHTDR